jgi:SagB-type dehydrogenase family enzyme
VLHPSLRNRETCLLRIRLTASRPSAIRRARTLVCYWVGAQLVFSNYRTRTALTATPVSVLLLTLLTDWCPISELPALLPRFDRRDVLRSVRRLVRHGLLVEKDTLEAAQDNMVQESWSAWLPHAGFFHFGTKDVPYESRPKQLLKLERALLKGDPQPPFFKSYPSSARTQLQRPTPEPGFPQVLLARRTRREFSLKEIPLDAFSKLLFYTCSVTGFLESAVFGPLPLKTSPSSGARHPIETYVLSVRIEGVKPGLYHYNPRVHCLEKIRAIKDPSARARQYCAGQAWARRAAALFIMTAVFQRSMWKYPTSRAYRTILLDAGHVCQTFCLVATWLNLASASTMALRDSTIERELQIDGVNESVLYIAGAGIPLRTSAAEKRSNLAFASL